jgi:phosphoglucomutase
MDEKVTEKINVWLTDSFDTATHDEIKSLQKSNNENELYDRFYKDLDFGTGGLRGKMGAGSNRMNIYTLGMATQGLANYIKCFGESALKKGVVIAYDSRNNSPLFARHTALVLAANGIKTYLFKDLRPTPLLSYAVKHLKTISGVVITASHNPPIYNGYKVYWEDGAQITPPHDKNIIDNVKMISNIDEVKTMDETEAISKNLLEYIEDSVDDEYYKSISTLSLNPENNKKYSDLKIAFSPIHGSGITLVEKALGAFGFNNVVVVESQKKPDGNFPTVKYPNPEEVDAMTEVIKLAEKENAVMAFGTDPDADRIAIAAKNDSGEFELFTGNQVASLLTYYVLNQLKENKELNTNRDFTIKTIVTTDLIKEISESFGVDCLDVLTGFKWIGLKIKELQDEGGRKFLYGGEESYGYLLGSFARDKDAVVIAALAAEVSAYAASQNKTLSTLLDEVYKKYGYYFEKLQSLTFEGFEGVQKIQSIMTALREKTPKKVGDFQVSNLKDYNTGIDNLPKSNVLLLTLSDGTKIFARPSGTEPKIKFYFMTHEKVDSELKSIKNKTQEKMESIISSFLKYIESV